MHKVLRVLPLTPEDVGAGVESVLQFKARAQGGHVTPAGTPSAQQAVGGRGGRQRAAAVAGGWRHQLPSRRTREVRVDSFGTGVVTVGCGTCTSTLHKHSSRLETTSENSGRSCSGNSRLMFPPAFMFRTPALCSPGANFSSACARGKR